MKKILDEFGIKATLCINGSVCDHYPQIVDAAKDADWEFMGHNIVQKPMHMLIWLTPNGPLCSGVVEALLHESSLARTRPIDRILTCRCDTTLVGRERSSDSGSHSRGLPHSPARLGSGREGHRR